MSTPRVAFVSHIHEEAPLALALKQVLERTVPEYSVWVSEQEITDGKQWLAALNTALDAADDLLVLCSSTSLSAPWVNFEGGTGEGAGDRVIPVCHRDLSIDDLPLPFSAYQGHQLATADDLRRLVDALGGRLEGAELDAAWRAVDAAGAEIDYVPLAVRPLAPPTGDRGVLVDLSHQQRTWPRTRERTVFTWPSGDRIDALADVALGSIDSADQLRARDLAAWQGLIVALPWHARLTEDTIDQVVEWVCAGGRLAMLGFELGDLHHESNLADLATRFALRFNGDIVAPPGWTGPGKAYNRDIVLEPTEAHPLFDGVSALRWRNVQTIAREPGTFPLLTIGANAVSLPVPESVGFADGHLYMPDPQFELVTVDRGVPVVASATPYLTGKGGVVAIGTWDIVPDGVDEPGNGRFAANLLRWLSGS